MMALVYQLLPLATLIFFVAFIYDSFRKRKLDERVEALEKEIAWLKGRLEGPAGAKAAPQRQGSVYRLDADR